MPRGTASRILVEVATVGVMPAFAVRSVTRLTVFHVRFALA